MSLYHCIDLLEARINKIASNQRHVIYKLLMSDNHLEQINQERELAERLVASFNQRIQEDDYHDFSAELLLINQYTHQFGKCPNYLNEIREDLANITQLFQRYPKQYHYKNRVLGKYESPEYKIAYINQVIDYRLGSSNGECFGYTYAMVDPELSPYKRPASSSITTTSIPVIHLNKKIYDYQKNQNSPERKIRNNRLTRRLFCPDIEQQAIQLLSHVTKYPGEEFCINLQYRKGSHATYLSVDENGFIRYMDPNCGAYLFKDPQDFIDFYKLNYGRENDHHYKFYQLAKITYDGDETLTESNSLQGKFRTFLSGVKYQRGSIVSYLSFLPMYFFYLTIIAALTLPFAILQPLTVTIIFSIITVAITTLLCIATYNGYYGILGISDYIREIWHEFTNKKDVQPPDLKENPKVESSTGLLFNRMTSQRNANAEKTHEDSMIYSNLFTGVSDETPLMRNENVPLSL
jgi:hypothetical protein